MGVIKLSIFSLLLFTVISCGQKEFTPATEVMYQGPLAGDAITTYASAEKVVQRCLQTKVCMGLGGFDYPLPKIRGMAGGNAVWCGDTLKEGCYTTDGYITVVHGGDAEIISHECVHHWLYLHTGDLDPMHTSPYFLKCGELSITEDTE